MRPNFFHHIHPPTIPAEQSRWRYTLGAGGTAVFVAVTVISFYPVYAGHMPGPISGLPQDISTTAAPGFRR